MTAICINCEHPIVLKGSWFHLCYGLSEKKCQILTDKPTNSPLLKAKCNCEYPVAKPNTEDYKNCKKQDLDVNYLVKVGDKWQTINPSKAHT